MTWLKDDPLARSRFNGRLETARAHRALLDYAMLGAGRSLAKLHQQYTEGTPETPPTRSLDVLKHWSSRFDWQARVVCFSELEAEAEIIEWSERCRKLRESDWTLGDDLRRKVAAFLEELPLFVHEDVTESSEVLPDGTLHTTRVVTVSLHTNLLQVAQALLAASKLQRLAVSEVTDNISLLSGSALDGVIERELRRLAGWSGQSNDDAPCVGRGGLNGEHRSGGWLQ